MVARQLFVLSLSVALVAACKASEPEPEPGPEPAARAATGSAAEPSAAAPPAAAPPAAAAPAAQPTAAQGPGEIDEKTLCLDAGLLLTEQPFEALADGGYCERCEQYDEMACELDWPSSDALMCPEWDNMRNTIYARHGKPFKKAMWRDYFATKPWYRADPSFTPDRLSPVAVANVAYLVKAGERCRRNCEQHDTGLCVPVETYLERLTQGH